MSTVYLSHFGLTTKPFQISTDPKFLWLGEKHKEALAVLKYGVLDNRGFLLLTGDVGTGKTTLINELINSLEDDVIAAMVPDPGLSQNEFFNYIARSFGIETSFKSKGPFLLAFETFLNNQHAKGKKTLLVIDEAQRLNQRLLEEIRLLSNIEKPDTKLLNVFFVGQEEFNGMLLEDRNRAIRQRITINYHIEPLTREEVFEYIEHRLQVAGAAQNPFSDEAVDALWSISSGYPRLINILCDQALLTAFVMTEHVVTEDFVRECAEELRIHSVEANHETQEQEPSPYPPEDFEEQPHSPPSPPITESGSKRPRPLLIVLILLLVLVLGGYLASLALQKLPLLYSSISSSLLSENAPPTKATDPGAPSERINNAGPWQQEGRRVAGGTEQAQKEQMPSRDAGQRTPTAPQRESDSAPTTAKGIETSRAPPVWDDMRVNFDHDSYDLTSESFEVLERVDSILRENPSLRVELTGYSDSTGQRRYNVWVSEFRANIVRSYLEGKGIASNRIMVSALGSADPIAPNTTREGRRLNRRVEIQFTQISATAR
jgi:general secretion pathway protein A